MINIRSNLFETNSSSMHSLVYCYDKPIKDYEFNKITYIRLKSYNRFPHYKLDTPLKKIRYIISYELNKLLSGDCLLYNITKKNEYSWSVTKKYSKILNKSRTNNTLSSKYNLDNFNRLIIELESIINSKIIITGSIQPFFEDGCIDVISYIEDFNVPLKDVILDPRFVIYVDGDEYYHFKEDYEKYGDLEGLALWGKYNELLEYYLLF